MKVLHVGAILRLLVAAMVCSGASSAQEKAGDELNLTQVRDGYAGRRAAIHSFGVRITYHENRRVLRGGPFRSIVQTIETVFDERGRAKIDMLESAPVEGEPGPAKPAGNRLLATTNIDGTRKLVTGTSRDPNNKVTALLGFISPERGLSWAVHPTELLCIFDYDPFASYIETGKGQVVGKEKLDGRETIRVEWGFDTNSPPGSALKGVYWFAPDLGYAIVSSEVFRRPMLSSPWRSFVRVDSRDFVKRDTVWLPGKINRVVNSYWDDGTYEHRSDLVAEFEDWTLNPALDDKMFKLVFPPKTLVRDEKTNAAYKSGEIGDPEIAGAVNQARKLDPGVLPEASRSLSTRFDVASSSDPIGRSNWSVSWWLALISAASILILGLVAFRRWARKSSG